ncbi:DUF6471 domain-containing protein [Maricaulis sp.]|uniref:DUF6471 domain-containing protein n=1 Tax=Maricaulis sp. TaxID=1486257 RepID=UPI00344CB0E2
MSDVDWNKQAKNILRAEMTRRDVSVKQLAEMIGENERSLANKLSRGSFTAGFMLQCLSEIGATDVRI